MLLTFSITGLGGLFGRWLRDKQFGGLNDQWLAFLFSYQVKGVRQRASFFLVLYRLCGSNGVWWIYGLEASREEV